LRTGNKSIDLLENRVNELEKKALVKRLGKEIEMFMLATV
jgi:hypothetical protein